MDQAVSEAPDMRGRSLGLLDSGEGIHGQPLANCVTSVRSPPVLFPLH